MSKLPVFEELFTETGFLGSVMQVAGMQDPVTGEPPISCRVQTLEGAKQQDSCHEPQSFCVTLPRHVVDKKTLRQGMAALAVRESHHNERAARSS